MQKRVIQLDTVKNPWNRRKSVAVFDIETKYLDSWKDCDKKAAQFICGVIYSYGGGSYHKFTNPTEFVKALTPFSYLVSYNGEGFDFLVLEKYGLKIAPYGNRYKPRE